MKLSIIFLPPLKSILTITIYIALAVAIYLILDAFGFIHTIPNNNNLINWDGKWYSSIVENGYVYIESMCNIAFFPLFPLIWKLTGFNPINISIFNFLIFLLSYLWILWGKNFSIISILFLLTLPSVIFFALPYSESIFFLSSSLIIIGLDRQSTLLTCMGLFFSSLTRSVSIVFIPAIIITHFLTKEKNWTKTILSISFSLLGTFTAVIIQYLDTGHWFRFLQVQEYWGRKWQVISLPLTTFNTENILGVDAFGLIVGLLSFYYLMNILFSYRKKTVNSYNILKSDKGLIFSLLYMCAITFIDCFFTTTLLDRTNIWSINRHILATPYAFYFLLKILNSAPNKIDNSITIFIIFTGLLVTKLYSYPLQFLVYLILSFWLFKLKDEFIFPKIISLFIIIIYQIYFYQLFLSNKWVG
ncbi:hypothetical protein [Sphingobacterium hungaricum]|uniref:Mannosyltransferase (PIG-V) n=1 Tax=Sphingobacterium hungaricum TaxID=2082723 RepID=A0A928YR03_9SPHI|nr:hypothetical protein [Sphingobacterium hungaricum]MBE8714806.1 hypothetical protein [Sphingobacterium hungaricum]